jgi:peptide/nickel transport system ATP-binding protein
VPGNRCETELPPMVELRDGHFIKCHLAPQVLAEMEPVITLEAVHDAEIAAASPP